MIGEIGGLAGSAAWAIVSTMMRSLSNRINPVLVTALRCAIGAATLAGMVVLLGHTHDLLSMPARNLALIVLAGVIGQGLGDLSFITSMKLIGAVRAMPISTIQPLITTAMAVLFLGEPVSWFQGFGTILVLTAVYLLTFAYGPLGNLRDLFSGADKRGVLLAITTAFCWATAIIILREALVGVDLVSANLIRMSTAFVLLTSIQLFTYRSAALSGIYRGALVPLVVVGVLGAFASIGYVVAISYAGAAKAAVLNATTPLWGLPISITFLGERVNRRIIVASLMCVSGIWLVLLG